MAAPGISIGYVDINVYHGFFICGILMIIDVLLEAPWKKK